MGPYPLALREAVLEALAAGEPVVVVANRLGIAPRTVRRYRQQYRREGHLRPRPNLGRRPLIPATEHARLTVQLRCHPAATLAAHCRMWEAQSGVRVSVTTMLRTVRRLGWTRQRRPTGHP